MTDRILLASDFDSTLCHWPQGIVDDRDRAAIRRFREAGNRFAVVTGRTYHNALWGFDGTDFHDMDACFCLSGALCFDSNGKVIYDRRADGAALSDIIDYFRRTGARYLAYDIGTESGFIDIGGDPDFPPTVSADEARRFESFTSLNAGYPDADTAKERAAEIGRLFGNVLTPLQNIIAIDMPPAGVNKAYAASYAAEMFGIARERVYTAGDNYNDISMVAEFHGCAMEYGPKELLCVAERKISLLHEVIDDIMQN